MPIKVIGVKGERPLTSGRTWRSVCIRSRSYISSRMIGTRILVLCISMHIYSRYPLASESKDSRRCPWLRREWKREPVRCGNVSGHASVPPVVGTRIKPITTHLAGCHTPTLPTASQWTKMRFLQPVLLGLSLLSSAWAQDAESAPGKQRHSYQVRALCVVHLRVVLIT